MWPFWGFFLPTHCIFHPQCITPANLPSIINANVSGKKTPFANLPLRGGVSTEGHFVHTLYFWNPACDGKRRREKMSMFMWKPSCGNLPGVWSRCEWRTWRWIFLNPRKPQGLYLEGVIQGEMENHRLKISKCFLQSFCSLQRTHPKPTAPEELPSSCPFIYILQYLFFYISKML